MPSLWQVVHHLANGAAWPPAGDEAMTRFLHRVNQESLLPLYFDRPPEGTIDGVAKRFKAFDRAHAARSRAIIAAMDRLAEVMAGEPFIVLKGCDYAFRLYPRPELRPMADIDILVPEGEMRRIADRLEKLGFTRQFPSGPASRVDSYHEAVFTVQNVTVEIHHRFIQQSRHQIDYGAIWKRAEPFEVSGVQAFRLSSADAIAYLTIGICLKYFVAPLIRYVDLWRLVETSGVDMVTQAAELAVQWKARHCYYAALRYGARLFPEFAADPFESATRVVLGPVSRRLMDTWVVPKFTAGPTVLPSRAVQLWRKFWTMDSLYRRYSFTMEQTTSLVRGHFAK